jgi:hypothetical protein
MKKLILSGVLMALLIGPSIAVENDDQADSERYRCAWGRYINNFKLVGDKTVILTQGVNRRYKVTLLNSCRDLRFQERIAIKSTGSCLGPGDSLIVRGAGGIKTRCVITDIVYLPKEDMSEGTDEESKEQKAE